MPTAVLPGMNELAIAAISLVIGAMVGATGIGGFLIIPSFVALLGLPVRQAVGSALVLGACSGVLGIWMFSRRGTLDWRIARPLVICAAVLAVTGGLISRYLPTPFIVGLLGCVVAAGSAASYLRAIGRFSARWQVSAATQTPVVAAIGAFSGLVAGITGAGGPVASIPLMVASGFAPLVSNGVGTVLQLGAGVAGATVYGSQGLISWSGLAWSLPFQLTGMWLGIHVAHRLDPLLATRIVAIIGMAAGVTLLVSAA